MDYARDSQGKLIKTHEAIARRYYRCPVCSAEVFLRRGKKYQHHFAHRSNRGKPECELFHPSENVVTTWAKPSTQDRGTSRESKVPPLSLSLELEPETLVRGRRLRQWGLRLTVPKSEDEHGRITVDFGTGHPRTFSLSRLVLESQTAVASLDADEFGVSWISPEVRPAYRSAIEERIPGLKKNLVNVFATTNQRYKPRSDILTWGESYYFVWRTDVTNTLSQYLPQTLLAPQGDWGCALVTLPEYEQKEVKEWLGELSGLSFRDQRNLFGVVLPAPCGIDVLGRLAFADPEQLLIGLSLEQTEESEKQLSISTGTQIATVSFQHTGRNFFQVGIASGVNSLTVRLGQTALSSFTSLSGLDDESTLSVVINFHITDQQVSRRVALQDVQSRSFLRRAREGEVELLELQFPSGVPAQLRWRRPPSIEWQETMDLAQTASSGGMTSATADQIAKINAILKNRSVDVALSFEPLGSFYDSGAVEVGQGEIVLSKRARNRIIWICKSAKYYTDKHNNPIEQLADSTLVSLLERSLFPKYLRPHKAEILGDIRDTNTRQTSQ